MKKYLLRNYNTKYKFPLKKITTILNNGYCKYYIIVNNCEELIKLIKYLKKNKFKYLIIGNGSKIVFRHNYKGVIISLKKLNNIIFNNYVEVGAGCKLLDLINTLKDNNQGGIEELIGIPASVGGAIRNNASAHNVALSDYLVKIIVMKDDKIVTLEKKDIQFKYRYSSLMDDYIILKCYFNFEIKEKDEINKKIKKYREYRLTHQETTYPNIGSIFKNKLIKTSDILFECKLENYKYKNVSFSKKHVNFIKIDGLTNGNYIYKFVNKIKKKVYKIKKIDLKTEINFI